MAENVGGLFSADDGVALARCIRELLDSGACEVGYVVLDSQYFGVAQRRKRVFIVSDFGGESCDEILAITESLPGHPAPSREAGKGTAGDASESVGEGVQFAIQGSMIGRDDKNGPGGCGYKDDGTSFTLTSTDKHGVAYEQEGIAFEPRSADGEPRITGDIKEVVSPTLNCMGGGQREPSVVSWNGDTTPKASEDVSVTLRSQQGGEGVGVATYDNKAIGEIVDSEVSGTITSNTGGGGETQNPAFVRENLTVRRLTPIECERLQGFPDNWTSEKMELILEGNEWKATGKVVKQADGPRYKAMGNAVTVNVAEWIGKQIGKVINK